MARKKIVMVVPNKDGGKNKRWQVLISGEKSAISNHRTKQTALDAAKTHAKELKTELQVRKLDGTISDPDSFGNDPRRIKDKKH